MKIAFKNQTLDLKFNVNKEYPIFWHTTEEGKVVDKVSITPVKGHVKISGDIEIDTGNLSVTSVFKMMRAIETLDRKNHEGCMKEAA